MMSDVASYLKAASDVADTVARTAPGPIGIAAKIASLALRVGSGVAQGGGDPVVEIARMLSPKSAVDGVHSEWDSYVRKNFPATRPPDSGPDSFEKRPTDPSMPAVTDEDIYEED